jgi:FKBP-type peptidyl-prolyl cis-trans isomerase
MKKILMGGLLAVCTFGNVGAEEKVRCKVATLDRFNIYATELTVDGTAIGYFDVTRKSYHGGTSLGVMLPSEIERLYLCPDSVRGVEMLRKEMVAIVKDSVTPEAATYIHAMLKQSVDNHGRLQPMSAITQLDKAYYSAEDRAYFEVLDRNEKIRRTDSGLRYEIISDAEGAKPTESSNVIVAYRGLHTDGQVFDENSDADFPVYTLIDGLKEGLCLMSEGAEYRFYLPSNLAYGNVGYGDYFRPGEPLIFEFRLRQVH